MSRSTFSECFCAKNNISRSEYARAVFRQVLYPRTRPFVWLLPFLNRDHFVADFDLIYAVEHLRRLRDFAPEAQRFNEHPANRGKLRRMFGLRVSTARLKALIRETLPPKSSQTNPGLPVADGTFSPFSAGGTTSGDGR